MKPLILLAIILTSYFAGAAYQYFAWDRKKIKGLSKMIDAIQQNEMRRENEQEAKIKQLKLERDEYRAGVISQADNPYIPDPGGDINKFIKSLKGGEDALDDLITKMAAAGHRDTSIPEYNYCAETGVATYLKVAKSSTFPIIKALAKKYPSFDSKVFYEDDGAQKFYCDDGTTEPYAVYTPFGPHTLSGTFLVNVRQLTDYLKT